MRSMTGVVALVAGAVALGASIASCLPASAETLELTIDGQKRSALMARPAPSGPRPTIIMLHGAGRTARDIAHETRLAELATREGWVAVFPEGRGSRWNFLPPGRETARDVDFFKGHGGLPDDIAFLRTIVSELMRRGHADPRRIYLAGLSLGGFLALRAACVDAGTYAAIGLLISGMSEVTGAECRPARPIPLLSINGTADTALPYAGGPSQRGDPMWSAARLLEFFRRLNGCSGLPAASVAPGAQPPLIEIERSTGCPGGPVIHYRVVGGAHAVPPSLNAGQLLIDFFRDKTR